MVRPALWSKQVKVVYCNSCDAPLSFLLEKESQSFLPMGYGP